MNRLVSKIVFTKRFVSGLLDGLDYEDSLTVPMIEAKEDLAHYQDLIRTKKVVKSFTGSDYIVTSAKIVEAK